MKRVGRRKAKNGEKKMFQVYTKELNDFPSQNTKREDNKRRR